MKWLVRLKEWWHECLRRLDDDFDRELDLCLADIAKRDEKSERYERLQRFYPNILARLEVAAERREKNLKYGC